MKVTYEEHEPFYLRGWQGTGFRGYPPMFHNHVELIYVVRGSIHMTVEDESFTLHAGQLFVLFSRLIHAYQDAPDAQVILLLFDPSVTAFTNTLLSKRAVWPMIDGTAFEPMLQRAVTLLRQDRIKTATGYLNAVLGEFLEVVSLETRPSVNNNMSAKVLEYCAEHFAEPLTLKSVADALFISQSYVSKLFSGRLHYGFRDYINALRIDQAKTLLQETNQQITDVMATCGFSNQSSFNRVFRESCGCSPREYKRKFETIHESGDEETEE